MHVVDPLCEGEERVGGYHGDCLVHDLLPVLAGHHVWLHLAQIAKHEKSGPELSHNLRVPIDRQKDDDKKDAEAAIEKYHRIPQ